MYKYIPELPHVQMYVGDMVLVSYLQVRLSLHLRVHSIMPVYGAIA